MGEDVIKFLKYSVGLIIIAAAGWFLTLGDGARAAVWFIQKTEKPVSVQKVASTDYRYNKEFEETLNRYGTFQSLYQEEYSTAIPGLEYTEIMGEISNQMVPQGICIAKDYMLVTAYNNSGAKSVVYVLSNQNPKNRRLLTTIVLPDANHAGGITYDGKRIWIAKSTTRKCSMIDYEIIEKAAESGRSSYELKNYTQSVDCNAVASFIAYHDGCIWVGTYSNLKEEKGILRSYKVVENSGLKFVKQEEIAIPQYANGVAFMEAEGKTYMAVATSKGRYHPSQIYFYQVAKDIYSGRNLYCNYGCSEFPPMAEELVCDEDNTYLIFESSATCYSTQKQSRCNYPVDRICALSTAKMFCDTRKPVYSRQENGIRYLSMWEREKGDYQKPKQYWRMYV